MYIHKTILSQHLLNCMCVLLDCAMFFWGKARPLLSFSPVYKYRTQVNGIVLS